jgi:hypothetical protein
LPVDQAFPHRQTALIQRNVASMYSSSWQPTKPLAKILTLV